MLSTLHKAILILWALGYSVGIVSAQSTTQKVILLDEFHTNPIGLPIIEGLTYLGPPYLINKTKPNQRSVFLWDTLFSPQGRLITEAIFSATSNKQEYGLILFATSYNNHLRVTIAMNRIFLIQQKNGFDYRELEINPNPKIDITKKHTLRVYISLVGKMRCEIEYYTDSKGKEVATVFDNIPVTILLQDKFSVGVYAQGNGLTQVHQYKLTTTGCEPIKDTATPIISLLLPATDSTTYGQPYWDKTQNQLYFTQRKQDEDIFKGQLIDSQLTAIDPVSQLNTQYDNSLLCIASDGKLLLSNPINANKDNRTDKLFLYNPSTFQINPIYILGFENKGKIKSGVFTKNRKHLFFSGIKINAKSGYNLFVSKMIDDSTYDAPLELKTINTDGNELYPMLSVDEKRLYFSSNGYCGYGGMDIFYSETNPQNDYLTWTFPINAGYKINSALNETSITWIKDSQAVFTREGSLYKYIIEDKKIKDSILPKTEPNLFMERAVHTLDTLQVADEWVDIYYYDDEQADGDIISLYLNGVEIVKKQRISNKKRKITVQLQSGNNALLLYAHNLGATPPNTAAIEIEDGYGNKKTVVTSDLLESGAIQINWKED